MTALLAAAPFVLASGYCALRWAVSGQPAGRHRRPKGTR